MSKETTSGLTQSVSRAMSILQCFTDNQPEQRVSDISQTLGLTPSLVSRLLATLEHEGLVEKDEDTGFFRLGKSILTLAGVALNHNRLRVEALEEMQELVRTLKLGVNLAILDGDTIFYLAHIDGPEAPRAYTLIGRRNPLHATGMGKVLLAHLFPEERKAYLARLSYYAYTQHTVSSAAQLERELAQVCKQGYATEIEELALGRACVAGPIRDRQGRVVAALSISGPLRSLRWQERKDMLTTTIIEVTDRISMRLGYITAPRNYEDWVLPETLASQTVSGES